MENLRKVLSFGGILQEQEIIKITENFETKIVKPGDHFFSAGQICDKLGFIAQGVFRVYISNDECKEATKYFMRKNQFMMDIESFYNNTPTDSAIQALTESRLLIIDRTTWIKLNESFPKLFILTKSLTESALMNKIKDNDFLHFGTAKQKYEEFVKRYPDLVLSVPQQHIASFLQITPQSLSRIRKNA